MMRRALERREADEHAKTECSEIVVRDLRVLRAELGFRRAWVRSLAWGHFG